MRRVSDLTRTRAWVESPLQLVNVIERAHVSGEPVQVHLRSSSRELVALASQLEPGLPDGVTLEGASARPPLRFVLSRRRVVGDLFSGQMRALLAVGGARRLDLVDDGSSTLHLARVLCDPSERFGRMARTEGVLARRLGAVSRRRTLAAARRGRVSLFTVYRDAPQVRALAELGVRLDSNTYEWLRESAPAAIGVGAATEVVLGSALHVDGMVTMDAYRDWLTSKAGEGTVYLPHRREPAELLHRWSTDLGLKVVQTGLPAELVLSRSPSVRRIVTLPTSAVATLRTLLAGSASVTVDHVDESWWTSSADAGIRAVFAELESMEVHGDESD